MLSYRHAFHAGNHADVLKHAVQALIIESLKKKEKPFIVLDTH
ncbi:23S rRNA (adenine(2030)-N(6))-methyltransferase RlmJ, partial [Aeromonas sp. CPF2-S1]|nr:23S rRNA (adenine(2030)-N(6))-methyltransferase RlmJ [Aeromonas sp. CPF2-S1]